MEVNCMDKFKYLTDRFFDFLKFVWKNRKGNKSIYVIRCWYGVAIALIGLYCGALYFDSNGNWHFALSTPKLGFYELLFFIVDSIISVCFLYVINADAFASSVETEIKEIKDNTKKTFDNTDKILAIVKDLEKKDTKSFNSTLQSILDNVVASLIEELKLDTACKILNEIEKLFAQRIKDDTVLYAKMTFYKGKSLLFSDSSKACMLIHDAYIIQPEENEYKRWEVRYLLANKDYVNAKIIASSIEDNGKSEAFVNVVSSNDESSVFMEVPENLREDFGFRQIILEHLINKGTEDVSFLMKDVNGITPTKLTFSTINDWLFAISLQRVKINNLIVFSFDSPYVEMFKNASQMTASFYEQLSNTEISDRFNMVRCLHCYWSYICSKDCRWISEFQKVDRKGFSNQRTTFSLMESSMLMLARRFEEAFAVVVSTCNVIDESIAQFVIMMSVHSRNILHLRWIFSQMKTAGIKINDQNAALIAGTLDKDRAMETETSLVEMDFETIGVKDLLLQLCRFHIGQNIEVDSFKDEVQYMSDELKAYAANLLAHVGDTQLAYDMLSPIVEESVDDIKLSMYLSVLSKMQEKTPMLYRILVMNRKAGNHCVDQLLWKEYQLDCAVADYENSLEAIEILSERYPDNVEIFANHIMTLGRLRPEELSAYEELAKNKDYPTVQCVALVYHAFAENGYLETATEILYRAAKNTDDYNIRNFYHSESMCGLIRSTVQKEFDVAKEGNYVLCDMDGKRIFYKAAMSSGNIGKVLLGVHKNDVVNVEISLKPVKLTIIGIYDKYFKLASDILREAHDGNNPGLQPFEIDMEHPLESLEEAIRKITKEESTPEERRRKAYEQYERGELGLLQLVPDDNMLSGYYNLLFTNFIVHVNIAEVELQQLKNISDESCFVLDLPTIISFAEFEAKTGLEIKGPKIITKVLHEYLRESKKTSIRIINGDFYESMRSGMLVSYSEFVDVDSMKHIENLLEWTEGHCKDVIADQALALFDSGGNTQIKDVLFSSLSMLLQQDSYFVTDDRKIRNLLPHPSIISTETYVRLFNDEKTSAAYSLFLFECGFRGVDLQISYILNEYEKMRNHEDNKMVAIMQNMQENPFLLSKAITCCIQLAHTELELNTLKITFTNVFVLALKGLISKSRKSVMQSLLEFLSLPIREIQITRQCLLDAMLIVDSNS